MPASSPSYDIGPILDHVSRSVDRLRDLICELGQGTVGRSFGGPYPKEGPCVLDRLKGIEDQVGMIRPKETPPEPSFSAQWVAEREKTEERLRSLGKAPWASSGTVSNQIAILAAYLIDEFGGPAGSESAISMAIRLLGQYKALLHREADAPRYVFPPPDSGGPLPGGTKPCGLPGCTIGVPKFPGTMGGIPLATDPSVPPDTIQMREVDPRSGIHASALIPSVSTPVETLRALYRTLSLAEDFFVSLDSTNAAKNATDEVRLSPLTELVQEALSLVWELLPRDVADEEADL